MMAPLSGITLSNPDGAVFRTTRNVSIEVSLPAPGSGGEQ